MEEKERKIGDEQPEQGSSNGNRIVLPAPAWGIFPPLAVLMAGALLSMLPFLIAPDTPRQVGLNVLSGFLQDGAFFLLPCLLVLAVLKQPPAMLGMYKAPLHKILLLGIPAGLIFYGLNTLAALLVNLLFPGKIASTQSSMALFALAENGFDTALLIIFFCIVAPAAEEMLFRAFFYPPLLLRFGRAAGILLTALIFAAMHLNMWTFLPLFVGGLGFALLYDKFRNLWVNICAHMTWNILTVILYLAG